MTLDAGKTLSVGAGESLSVSGGQINGTLTGSGLLEKNLNEPLTIASGATLSTGEVMIFHGLLNVLSGATYDTPTETWLRGGNLELAGPAQTGSLSISSGDLNGTGSATLAVSGEVGWHNGSIGNGNGSTSKLRVSQTGGGAFSIFGTGEARLLGGAGVSIETTSPVSITNPEFRATETAAFTTTSTLTLGSGSEPQQRRAVDVQRGRYRGQLGPRVWRRAGCPAAHRRSNDDRPERDPQKRHARPPGRLRRGRRHAHHDGRRDDDQRGPADGHRDRQRLGVQRRRHRSPGRFTGAADDRRQLRTGERRNVGDRDHRRHARERLLSAERRRQRHPRRHAVSNRRSRVHADVG